MGTLDPHKSRLTGVQRGLFRGVVAMGSFMLANTLYILFNRLADDIDLLLFVPTEMSLPRFYQAIVLLHTGVGVVLAIIVAVFAGWHLTRVWVRRSNRTALISGLAVITFGMVLAGSGLLILTEANSRDNRWAFWTHIVCAALVPGLYLLHRRASIWKPSARACQVGIGTTVGVAVLLLGLQRLTNQDSIPTPEAGEARIPSRPADAGSKGWIPTPQTDDGGFVPAAYVPPESPFFPAAATTTTGSFIPSRFLTPGGVPTPEELIPDLVKFGSVVNEVIGAADCERCHADIVAQWAVSAHRFSSFNNPFYEAAVNELRRVKGKGKSKWCGGCHDPVLMLSGRMSEAIDRTSLEAQAGLTCLACHAVDRIHNLTGNGNYNIADIQADPYLFSKAQNGFRQVLHDAALKARPSVHKRRMMRPEYQTPEFCATCHKVSLDVDVNDYRWFRGQDEYGAWHDSGVSLNASRTFYLPSYKLVCQDCHMPPEPVVLGDLAAQNGTVRSHRFLAANTALPYIRGDVETIRQTEAFLQERKLQVDLFAVRTTGEDAVLSGPLNRVRTPLVADEIIQVEAVVRNLGVGHAFPGGTIDSNEGWLAFSVLDEEEWPVAVSGFLREDASVDPAGHFYKALMVDRHGQPIHKRNAQDLHASVYVHTIGPGSADVVRYRFRVPENLTGRSLILRVHLLWRKFDREFTRFAFATNRAGFPAADEVPNLPITVIATDEVILPVVEARQENWVKGEVHPSREDWMRFNDYGIGLLQQGDTRGAAWAFQKVVEADSARIDGYRNLARAAVQDGNLKIAYASLQHCETIDPGNAQTAWVWGVALQREGRYDAAAAAYERVLEGFPEDRAAWRNLSRVRFLNGKFVEALEAADRVLAIDPEDRATHYNRMLVLRGLGRGQDAAAAEEAYQKYQIDESAQEVTRKYLLSHPEDEREAQTIHTHVVSSWVSDGRRHPVEGKGW